MEISKHWNPTQPYVVHNYDGELPLKKSYELAVLGFEFRDGANADVVCTAPLSSQRTTPITLPKENDKLKGMFVTIKTDLTGVKLLGKANKAELGLKKAKSDENTPTFTNKMSFSKAKATILHQARLKPGGPVASSSTIKISPTKPLLTRTTVTQAAPTTNPLCVVPPKVVYADPKQLTHHKFFIKPKPSKLSVNIPAPHKTICVVNRSTQTDSTSTCTLGTNTEHVEEPQTAALPFSEANEFLDLDSFNIFMGHAEHSMGPYDFPQVTGEVPAENMRIKQMLFQDLVNCDKYDEYGNLPLHDAVFNNDYNLSIRFCTALIVRNFDINVCNQHGQTALQLAVMANANIGIIDLLVNKYYANMNVIDANGNNIIHLAVLYSQTQVIQMLVPYVSSKIYDGTNFDGYTPLILSVIQGDYTIAEALLKEQVDPNVGDKKSGRCALFHAVEYNNAEIVDLLLKYDAQTKVKNFFGTSPHDAMFELEHIDKDIKDRILNHRNPKMKYRKKRSKTVTVNFTHFTNVPDKRFKLSPLEANL